MSSHAPNGIATDPNSNSEGGLLKRICRVCGLDVRYTGFSLPFEFEEKISQFVRPSKGKSALQASRKGYISFADSWYFLLLDSSYKKMAFVVFCFYLIACIIFTLIAYPFTGQIQNATNPNKNSEDLDWTVAIVFSVTHVITMGYGQFFPYNVDRATPELGLFALASCQQFAGILINVLVFTIVVTKIQHPTSAIIFSRKAILTKRNGVRVLLFR
jgi:hypothetical protein